jgi:Domain of unknown function (DUF4148)
MKSKLIAASVFAAAGFLSVSSFADSGNGEFYPVPHYGQSTSTLSRAEVKAELAQARRDGTLINYANNDSAYPPAPVATTGGKTRAEVKAELMAASPLAPQYEVDHNYPNVQ